jgi:hypothetical protein
VRDEMIATLERVKQYTAEARENSMRLGMRWSLEDAEREIDGILAALRAEAPRDANAEDLVALQRRVQSYVAAIEEISKVEAMDAIDADFTACARRQPAPLPVGTPNEYARKHARELVDMYRGLLPSEKISKGTLAAMAWAYWRSS